MKKSLVWLLLALLAACAGEPADTAPVVDEALAPAADDKADGTTELRVRAGETTVWVDRLLERRGDTFVLGGRGSRNLVDGRAFVFDDVYGAFTRKSARTFEISWHVGEVASLVQGVPQFVGLTFAPSRGRPDDLTARVVVRPRLAGLTGRFLYFDPELKPVVSGGRVVYRLEGRTKSDIETLAVDVGDVNVPDVARTGPRSFHADLQLEHVLALAGDQRLSVRATLATGRTTRRASVALGVRQVGLTTGDAEAVWPPATCAAETAACIAALPAGATDLGSCGEAVAVLPCLGAAGAAVTDAEIGAALAALDARLDAAFRDDAAGLVGDERAEAFAEGTRLSAEDRLERQFGRRYPDAAARDAALAAEIEAAIDAAYARPLDLVEPLAPSPERAGDAAADALLAHLAGLDLRETEWARPLEALTRQFRARHVASVRAFREEIVPEDGVYLGRWLDAYVEVAVDPATGAVTNLYFEVD